MSEDIPSADVVRLGPSNEAHVGDEPEVRFFQFRRGRDTLSGFALLFEGKLSAFVNRCPHWMVDLDLGEKRIWSHKTKRILCVNHGALFHPQSGHCEWGPCLGEGLESLAVHAEGRVWVVQLGMRDQAL
jgi:nitrite reductase/ring-hydroxylating ferredoxin subunit